MKLLAIVPLLLAACAKKQIPVPVAAPPGKLEEVKPRRGEGEPDRVELAYVLVSFRGHFPDVTRSEEEARRMAEELLEQARKGGDFQLMFEQKSDMKRPSFLGIANYEVRREGNELSRESVSLRVGNTAFRLKVGEIGLAEYDPRHSPRGWYVLKRVK